MNVQGIFDDFADDDGTLSPDAWVFACGELAEAGDIVELDEETLQSAFMVLFELDEPANIPFEEFEKKLPYFIQNAQDEECLEAFLAEVVENGFHGATGEEPDDGVECDQEYEAVEDDDIELVEEHEAEELDDELLHEAEEDVLDEELLREAEEDELDDELLHEAEEDELDEELLHEAEEGVLNQKLLREAEEDKLDGELSRLPPARDHRISMDAMSPSDMLRTAQNPSVQRPAVSFVDYSTSQSPTAAACVSVQKTSPSMTTSDRRSTRRDARRNVMSGADASFQAASVDFLPVPRPPTDESLKIRMSPSVQVLVKKPVADSTARRTDADNDKAKSKQGKKKERDSYLGPPRFAAETLRGLSPEGRNKVMHKELEALHEEIAHELRARNSAIRTLAEHYPATFARSPAPMKHTAFEVRVASMKHGPIRTPDKCSVSSEPNTQHEEYETRMSPAEASTLVDVQHRVENLLSKLHVKGASQIRGVDAVRAGLLQVEKELNLMEKAAVVRQQNEPRRSEHTSPSTTGALPWRSTKNESRGFSHTPWPVFGTARNFYGDPPLPRAIHKARETLGIYNYHDDDEGTSPENTKRAHEGIART